MFARTSELEMVSDSVETKYHTIEAIVVLKARDNTKAKTTTIHVPGSLQIANRSCKSQMIGHGDRVAFSSAILTTEPLYVNDVCVPLRLTANDSVLFVP